MSDSVERFVSMVLPEVIEGAGQAYMRPTSGGQPTAKSGKAQRKSRNLGLQPSTTGLPPKLRAGANQSLGKQEVAVPTPDQVSLEQALNNFVTAAGSPERQTSVLIKIGMYRNDLAKVAPQLHDVDADTARETLEQWMREGDGEMKKALINVVSGEEDFPLLKMVISEGPEYELAKMLDDAPDARGKAALLQKIDIYQTQVHQIFNDGALMKSDPAQVEETLELWLKGDDGSHAALRKAVLSASRAARAHANAQVGENEAVDEKAGNAPSHVGSRLSGQNDRTYVPRPTGEGAGKRMRGSESGMAPGQAEEDCVDVGSGPTDEGGGELPVKTKIRRKGATGGLGSVSGEIRGHKAMVNDHGGFETDADDGYKGAHKSADLGIELLAYYPDAAIDVLSKSDVNTRVALVDRGAQHAADLMAWHDARRDSLQKSEMDQAVSDWLTSDPNAVQLKQWVAEALATAEEIPLGLAKAIMAYEAGPVSRIRRRAA